MNIRGLITAATLATALLLMVLSYVFVRELEVNTLTERARGDRELAITLEDELRQSSDDLSTAARAYVASGNEEYEKNYFSILAIRDGEAPRPEDYSNVYWDFVFANGQKPRPDTDISVALNSLIEEANFSQAELDYLKASEKASEALVALEAEAFNAMKGRYKNKNGNYARLALPDQEFATNLMFSKQYFDAKAKVMKPIEEFKKSLDERTEAAVSSLTKEASFLGKVFIGLVIMTLLSLGLLGYLISKQSQIRLAERAAAQAAAEAENEQLNDSVINILEAVSSLSQRDLTARAPVTEDVIGTVSDSINLLADETADVLSGVTDIAGQVSTVSDTVRSQAAQVSQTAEEERESVQKMFETLFETTQTMNQVAALAEQSNDSAAEATEVTQGALQTVNNTVTGMESIRDTISETEKRIKRLGERSQEISGIVNLINTISERTHVLALNASMQAAVAGEAGRGFAVVAEEVQQLAESSRNATEQIATLVNNIQIETNETINTVNLTIGQVVEGSEQAQQAGEQMRKTQAITSELVSRVQSIAQASQQQKNMSAQLLEAVQDIGESTEKTAEQIDAQNEGTEELQNAAKLLVESVNVFKLPQRS